MADQLYFSRDTKVFLELINPADGATYSPTVVYELPVLDGYSFSQATNTSEVTLNEMSDLSGNSRRARQMFTNSFNPAEWSFTSYVRPFASAAGGNAGANGEIHAVEEALWAAMVGDAAHSSPSIGSAINALGSATQLPSTDTDVPDGTKTLATTTDGNGNGATLDVTVASGVFSVAINGTGTGYSATDQLFVSMEALSDAFNADLENFNYDIAVPIASVTTTTGKGFTGFTRDSSDLDIDFTQSNKSKLGTFNLYFKLGQTTNKIYKISNCCVNEASLEFDIDGIASIAWSGMGTTLTDVASAPAATIDEGTTSTSNFIRNRLTALDVDTSLGGDHPSTYNLVLTGGNVTISNNMTFLTPETLGTINTPLGHVTGTRSVTGSFTCYLNSEDDSSAELFKNIAEDTSTITNVFDLTFHVGGNEATPGLQLHMENCHLEVPTHGIEDVISLETNFHALPSSIESANELSIKYKGS